MIEGINPILQAGLATLFTWGLTAAGAAMVFFVPTDLSFETQRKVLDASLGFAAGVMIAASYWSLLAPAQEAAEESGSYGESSEYVFIPLVVGVLLGCLFVGSAHLWLPDVSIADVLSNKDSVQRINSPQSQSKVKQRLKEIDPEQRKRIQDERRQSWKRIVLLVLAITVHNFPEGLAVGVGFGAIKKSSHATFGKAYSLAIGIGLQNFPEGLAVSLPLLRLGYSPFKSFWYGQLSGMVEPIAGIIGACGITIMQPLLPYALSFAAGAMLYVVVDDLIPEAREAGNEHLASIGFVIGFIVMMSMDVGLG